MSAKYHNRHRRLQPYSQRGRLQNSRGITYKIYALASGLLGLAIFVAILFYIDWMMEGGPEVIVNNTGFAIFGAFLGIAALVASGLLWHKR